LLLFLLPLFHERTILVGGAEIHIDAFDPVAFKAEKLRIAKTPAAFCQAFVGHKGLIETHLGVKRRKKTGPSVGEKL
jgi:hypothetical protein